MPATMIAAISSASAARPVTTGTDVSPIWANGDPWADIAAGYAETAHLGAATMKET